MASSPYHPGPLSLGGSIRGPSTPTAARTAHANTTLTIASPIRPSPAATPAAAVIQIRLPLRPAGGDLHSGQEAKHADENPKQLSAKNSLLPACPYCGYYAGNHHQALGNLCKSPRSDR